MYTETFNKNSSNKKCDTCMKQKVCSYKELRKETESTVSILNTRIGENNPIQIEVSCSEYTSEPTVNFRSTGRPQDTV